MFGISQVFSAFKRLVNSVNKTADLFDTMNVELERRFVVEQSQEQNLLESDEGKRNGNSRVKTK